MAVAQFPSPSNYTVHVGDPTGPPCLKIRQLKPERPSVIFKEMVDGGGTYGANSTTKVLRWELTFGGLTTTQAAQLDDHNDSAYDTLLGFSWRDPRTDTLHTDTHYESYDRDHSGQYGNSQSRSMILVKRPT